MRLNVYTYTVVERETGKRMLLGMFLREHSELVYRMCDLFYGVGGYRIETAFTYTNDPRTWIMDIAMRAEEVDVELVSAQEALEDDELD